MLKGTSACDALDSLSVQKTLHSITSIVIVNGSGAGDGMLFGVSLITSIVIVDGSGSGDGIGLNPGMTIGISVGVLESKWEFNTAVRASGDKSWRMANRISWSL